MPPANPCSLHAVRTQCKVFVPDPCLKPQSALCKDQTIRRTRYRVALGYPEAGVFLRGHVLSLCLLFDVILIQPMCTRSLPAVCFTFRPFRPFGPAVQLVPRCVFVIHMTVPLPAPRQAPFPRCRPMGTVTTAGLWSPSGSLCGGGSVVLLQPPRLTGPV
jgi:hypothetical protein